MEKASTENIKKSEKKIYTTYKDFAVKMFYGESHNGILLRIM